jgi:hypothetical protein
MKQLQMHLFYLRIVGSEPAAQSKIASEIKIKVNLRIACIDKMRVIQN